AQDVAHIAVGAALDEVLGVREARHLLQVRAPLTGRYRQDLAGPDTTAGIELSVDADGSLSWAGVPPAPGFRERLEEQLAARGFVLHTEARRER
ncbi:hypothetical protein ACWCQV_42400, partial [Streptomyces eurythermus]